MIKDQPMNPECAGVYGQNFDKNEFKTKDNTTPRPWKVSDLDKCRIVADDNAGRYVAITYHDMLHNTEMNEANAQLIVKAVNCHDELREALKKCRLSLEVYVNGGNPNSPYKDGKHSCYVLGAKEALKQAKQALSKAESEPIK